MFSDEELLRDPELLRAEAEYWDRVDEADTGIPFKYVTQKQVVYLREGESE
jgi:hypothetical protein